MQAVAMGLSIVGGLVGAVEAVSSARRESNQLEINARTAGLNANIARQNAALEGRRRERELAESRRKFNITRGNIISQSSALGLLGGSVGDVLSDADTQATIETVAIKDERNSAVAGALNQANAFDLEASSLRAGKNSGIWGAVGSLVSGFGGAAKMKIT